jgi:hypothetical protein
VALLWRAALAHRRSPAYVSGMSDSWPGWRPMSEFDPSKPALVHDKLNDQVIDWRPERHGADYKAGHRDFGDGVIEWDGLLLDGWKPL